MKPLAQKQGGQVALFIALIFQVLFVFFAMLVNVGLLVHHKINLQNSVDLAAYYGAMKQAETMNAIAHVNYQIRQSWKLLNFRYRHLGDWGATGDAPVYLGAKPGDTNPGSDDTASAVKDPVFCVNYTPFSHIHSPDNYCLKANTGAVNLTAPPIPDFSGVAGLANAVDGGALSIFLGTTTTIFQNLQNQMANDCNLRRAYNIFALARFMWDYKQDISMRKRLLISLAQNISKNDSNGPLDLDGNKIETGVMNTLKKNLTYQNADTSLGTKGGLQKVQFYNSLADPSCGSQGSGSMPPSWLQEIYVFPLLFDLVPRCDTGSETAATPSLLNVGAHSDGLNQALSDTTTSWGTYLSQLLPLLVETNAYTSDVALYNSSLGFEKNPWCMAYVGVSAQTIPQIPFSPFGSITLTATAYAKPFGGTIGPWYSKSWPFSSNPTASISTGDPTDAMQIPRWSLQTGGAPSFTSSSFTDHLPVMDYSRYIGDVAGTGSKTTMYAYGKTFLDVFNSAPAKPISLDWWAHLLDPSDILENVGTSGDVLAYSKTDPNYASMRDFEIAAVAPDNFDVTYYSIEPDFYRNYYQRLSGGQSPPSYLGAMNGRPVRGDIGMSVTDSNFKTFSVKEQISKSWSQSHLLTTFGSTLPYFAGGHPANGEPAFSELLTSFKLWVSDTAPTVQSYFGHCQAPVGDGAATNFATTGNCISGGRVGYSVKLVDGDFLKNSSSMPLGGPSTSGAILNKPPSLSDSLWKSLSFN